MPTINKSITVPYSTDQMYALVNEVETYPEFVPACRKVDVLAKNDDEIQVRLHFVASGFQKSFTTCNRLQPGKMIEMRLIDGPFRQLQGYWRFEATENGCIVNLDLEFEFASRLLANLVGPIFSKITYSLVDAFSERAKKVYGHAG